MVRPKRLKLKDGKGFFHLMSKTVGQEFYLSDVEKEEWEETIFLTTPRQKV